MEDCGDVVREREEGGERGGGGGAAQSLLNSTSEWLQWADMKAKVPK